jgi:hypothetical protein
MKKGVRSDTLREAHTIPKGTTLYRATTSDSEENSGSTYVSYLDADREHYRGNGYVKFHGGEGAKLYENTYTLDHDLNVPSRQESMDVVNEVMSKNQKLVNSTIKAYAEMALPKDSVIWMEYASNQMGTGEFKNENQVRKQYVDEMLRNYKNMTPNQEAFFVMQTFAKNKPIKDAVIAELSKRGYNAMTDEASVGGQNGWGREGADPLIIFDRKGTMTQRSHVEVSEADERNSLRKRNKIMSKASANGRRNVGMWSGI